MNLWGDSETDTIAGTLMLDSEMLSADWSLKIYAAFEVNNFLCRM